MKKAILHLFYLLLALPLLAQDFTQTIRGSVIDTDSKSPLVAATVVIIDAEKIIGGAYTDEEGRFSIAKVPIGRYTIRVTYLGYEELSMRNILVSSGKEVVLNLELQEKIILGDTVQIVAAKRTEAQNEMATVSTRPFTIEETRRYAGSLNDPARMARNFAGVNGANDSRNDIIIRGNSPMGVLWRLEGIDIPNPNHFSTFGTTGGPIGMLNNNTLANSDFLTGAFPAEYGNALAGVFDLKMRKGNDQEHEFLGQLGMNGIELLAEGPFSKKSKASYLFSYRYNNLALFKFLKINFGSSAIPEFQDASFKINVPTQKAGTFSVFGVGGLSDAKVLDSERDTSDFYGPAGTDASLASGMFATGISHLLLLDDKSFLRTTLAWSGTKMSAEVDTVDKITHQPGGFYNNYSDQNKLTLSLTYNRKFNARHTVKAGVFAEQMAFNLLDSVYLQALGRWVMPTDFKGTTQLIQPYVQWKYRITESLVLNAGLHYQFLAFNSSQSLEPRVGLRWSLPHNQALAVACGKHSMTQPIFVYYHQREDANGNLINSNHDLGFTKSQHFVLAYDNSLAKNLRLRVETYYQILHGAPVEGKVNNSFSLLNQGADFWFVVRDSLVNTGLGRNYGLEFTLEKFLSRNYYFLITASLYDSRYQGSDGVWRNTAFNGRFAGNILGGADFNLNQRKTLVLSLNAKATLAGGKLYTPIDQAASQLAGNAVFLDDQAYSKQFKPYFRSDFRVALMVNSKKVSQSFAIDISNIFNTQNPMFQIYDPDANELRVVNQLGILPVAQYRIEF
ncbi:MAG: TonB-dependent receptor [Bacteroidia bacterium]|nr:TonB-dependent receptor [Bacteroidia bacterium]